MVSAYSGPAGGNQETSLLDRSVTRTSPTSALWSPRRSPAAALVEVEPSASGAKRRKNPRFPHPARLVPST